MRRLLQILPFLAVWSLLLVGDSLRDLALVNGALQVALFVLVVCIPTWRTGRMSYVDIGWPWGLVGIGVVIFLLGSGDPIRIAAAAGAYALVGGRMGVFALKLWRQGAFSREFPRYRYQEMRWQRRGETDVPLARQIEVLSQGLANASFLALPAFVMAVNPAPELHPMEWIGGIVALLAFILESVADGQKARFAAACKRAGERGRVCEVGLWRYSRHPNYFFEWMVWNGLILMTLPSLPHLFELLPWPIAVLLTAALVSISRLMYQVLVHHTGARPAEFFSVQKRPGYAEYQRTTNRFFPGPRRP